MGMVMKDSHRYETILAGSGGQGLVLAGIMLGEAAMLEGRIVVQTQSYEAASRGGFSMAEVIIDTQEIVYQQVQEPDIILALTEESMVKYAPLAEEGLPLFYDTTLVKARAGTTLFGYPFTQMATNLGNTASVNILSLGAIIARVPMIRAESLVQVIRRRFKGKAVEMNINALEKGAELVR